MRNFTILLTVIALTALISCSGAEEASVYGGYDDDADTSSQNDQGDSSASSDTDTDKTDTADTVDTTDTGADTANTGTDTADTGADTADTGADTANTGTDTADTGADTADTGADTADTGADTADTGADTANTGTDTANTGADTGADTANTGADTGADTGDTESCTPNCEGKVCGEDDGCEGKCDGCEEGKFCTYEYKCIPTECATVTEINLNTSLDLDASSIDIHSPTSAIFTTSYTPNTGTDTKDTFFIKFANLESYNGTFLLKGKNWDDESGFFLYVKEDSGLKTYFQKNGTVETYGNNQDDGWSETETVQVKLTGVMLEEVTISNNHSTPVTGGACLQVKNTTLEFKDSERTYSWLYALLAIFFPEDGWN